jgi:hypothetical protein
MKKLLSLTLSFSVITLVAACGDNLPKLPDGFELVAADGNSYFVYIAPENIGNKRIQREAGKILCEEIVKTPEYCEVWYWSNKSEIPKKLPIINRKTIIGLYQMKGDQIKLKALSGSGNDAIIEGLTKQK